MPDDKQIVIISLLLTTFERQYYENKVSYTHFNVFLALTSTSAYAFDSMDNSYSYDKNNKKIEQVEKLNKLDKQTKSQKRLSLLTEKEAKEIALNHERFKNSANVVIRDIDLEHKTIYKNNTRMKRPVYDIELLKDAIEYEIYIDAQTGEILKAKQDND